MNFKEKLFDFLFLDTGNTFADAFCATCIFLGCILFLMFFVTFVLSNYYTVIATIVFIITFAVFYWLFSRK